MRTPPPETWAQNVDPVLEKRGPRPRKTWSQHREHCPGGYDADDAKIRSAKPRAKPYKLTGGYRLYLLVKPGGSKLWKWSYTYGDKQKTMHFGIYPMVRLARARAKRDEARAQLGEGRDPGVVKRLLIEENLRASELTFEFVAREWHMNTKSSGRRSMPTTFCEASRGTYSRR